MPTARDPKPQSVLFRWVAAVAALALCAAGFLVSWPAASAATTPVSTMYQTAIDETNGSAAASAGAPGGVVTGIANPGDTAKWIVGYQNNTGAPANVDLRDPLTNAGAFVPGSLQLPPNPNQAQP